MRRARLLTLMLGALFAGAALAAPPELVNFQGAATDDLDDPLDGDYDIVFSYWTAPTGGDQILVDRHTTVDSASCLLSASCPVTISEGLFSVPLGGGAVLDGTGPGTYTSLVELCRDYDEIWLELNIEGETLSPRTRLLAGNFSIGAHLVDGMDGDQFLRSDTADVAVGPIAYTAVPSGSLVNQGPLLVNPASASTNDTLLGLAVGGSQRFLVDADGDAWLNGMLSAGSLGGNGSGLSNLNAGALSFGTVPNSRLAGTYGQALSFTNGSNVFAGDGSNLSNLNANFLSSGTVPNGRISGGYSNVVHFNNGSNTFDGTFSGVGSGLTGVNATSLDGYDSSLFLRSNVSDVYSGSILQFVGGARLWADDGTAANPGLSFAPDIDTGFFLPAGNTLGLTTGGSEAMRLTSTGNATLVGDLTVNGGDIALAGGGRVDGGSTFMQLIGGNTPTDDLILWAGGNLVEGRIGIFGSSSIELRAGNGIINFMNGGAGTITAALTGNGQLQIDSNLIAGTAGSVAYNAFGFLNPTSGDMSNDGDVYVGNDIEVDGQIYGSRSLYMEGSTATGLDADQNIWFYEAGNREGERFGWDDSEHAFVMTDDLVFDLTTDAVHDLRNAYDIVFRKDIDNDNGAAWFRFYTDISTEQLRIVDGDEASASFDGAVYVNGLDYAEAFRVTDPTLESGDVVSLVLDLPGYVERARAGFASHVIGVVSENPGFVTGRSFNAEKAADAELAELRDQALADGDMEAEKQYTQQLQEKAAQQQKPVALLGRVPVKVDGSYGPIRAGDRLGVSLTPGHATALSEPGPSLGIALEAWDGPGTGTILAFINRADYTPSVGGGTEEAAAEADAGAAEAVGGTQTVAGHLQLVLDRGADDSARLSVFRDGEEQGALGAEVFRIDEKGNVYAKGSFRPDAMDLAEYFPLSGAAEVGDVLVVDRESPGKYRPGHLAADPAVVGIVSAGPGVLLGSGIHNTAAVDPELAAELDLARAAGDIDEEARIWADLEARFRQGHAAVALSGTVPCKVDAGYGAVAVGDLLTTSPTPGHAMRSDDHAAGTIIGKALEPLETDTGMIRVLVMMR